MGTGVGPTSSAAPYGLLPPGQHSSRSPCSLNTLKNKVAMPSYSKWITRAPSVRQDRATSPHPCVMKTTPRGTTSTSAPVAKLQHPACCSHSSSGPLSGSSSAKNFGSRIHEAGGITAHTTNSCELPSAWVRRPAGRVATAHPSPPGVSRRRASPSCARAYKGRGKPGGGFDCQGLVTSCLTLALQGRRNCFFGGRGSDPS